jgi:hypothetical protein
LRDTDSLFAGDRAALGAVVVVRGQSRAVQRKTGDQGDQAQLERIDGRLLATAVNDTMNAPGWLNRV